MRPTSLAFLAIPLLGCGPLTRSAQLYYPPRDQATAQAVPAAFVPANTPPFVVQEFEDRREFLHVGDQRSTTSGRQYVRIATDVDVAEWVREGIAAELERSGIEVSQDGFADSHTLLLSGRVHEAYALRRHFYGATVEITGIVRCACHGKILLLRKYQGATTLPEDDPTEDPYGEALSRALQRTAQILIADIGEIEPCSSNPSTISDL